MCPKFNQNAKAIQQISKRIFLIPSLFNFQLKIQINGRDYNAEQKESFDALYSLLYTIYHHFDKIVAKQKRSDVS